jgi:hypothetical protein
VRLFSYKDPDVFGDNDIKDTGSGPGMTPSLKVLAFSEYGA